MDKNHGMPFDSRLDCPSHVSCHGLSPLQVAGKSINHKYIYQFSIMFQTEADNYVLANDNLCNWFKDYSVTIYIIDNVVQSIKFM